MSTKIAKVRNGALPVTFFVTAILFSAAALASNGKQELSIAARHAGIAASAANVDGVHLHLHHTLNCLEGTGGKDFDAKAANPCAGMGSGAISDAHDAALKSQLVGVVTLARQALAESDYIKAKNDAQKAADTLSKLSK